MIQERKIVKSTGHDCEAATQRLEAEGWRRRFDAPWPRSDGKYAQVMERPVQVAGRGATRQKFN